MRSKALFVANLLATAYTAFLIYVFGEAIVEAVKLVMEYGGEEVVEFVVAYFQFAFELLYELAGTAAINIAVMYALIILMLLHFVFFPLGMLFGWIAWLSKKSGGARFAATLYLFGTIFFPIFIVFGLPITIMGYVGASKQKKINRASVVV